VYLRGARLADALGLDMDPASPSNRRAIEVFPHPEAVVLFDLPKTLKYKRGPFDDRKLELLKLMTLIEGLDTATPRLRVNRKVDWVELRRRVEAATRPGQLDTDEDAVDAVLCAYVALYSYQRPEDITVYGDYQTGYIVTPTLQAHRAARKPLAAQRDTTELSRRLADVEALLGEAQRGLADIRRRLDL
jgi:predicted RNase H-like nuclease